MTREKWEDPGQTVLQMLLSGVDRSRPASCFVPNGSVDSQVVVPPHPQRTGVYHPLWDSSDEWLTSPGTLWEAGASSCPQPHAGVELRTPCVTHA